MKVRILSLRREGSKLHVRCPNPVILHRRDEAPKHLALKTNGEDIQESHRATGDGNLLLKGLHVDSL